MGRINRRKLRPDLLQGSQKAFLDWNQYKASLHIALGWVLSSYLSFYNIKSEDKENYTRRPRRLAS